MIGNLLNTALGIWLTYAAMFLVNRNGGIDKLLLVAGAVIVVLALWARRTDVLRWAAIISIALGAFLLVLAGLHIADEIPHLAMFWGVFWVGILVAILSLWAALYRPAGEAAGAPETGS